MVLTKFKATIRYVVQYHEQLHASTHTFNVPFMFNTMWTCLNNLSCNMKCQKHVCSMADMFQLVPEADMFLSVLAINNPFCLSEL